LEACVEEVDAGQKEEEAESRVERLSGKIDRYRIEAEQGCRDKTSLWIRPNVTTHRIDTKS